MIYVSFTTLEMWEKNPQKELMIIRFNQSEENQVTNILWFRQCSKVECKETKSDKNRVPILWFRRSCFAFMYVG